MTQAERIRIALAREILSGERPPGSTLDEQGLAVSFSVSRTPIREALRLLAASGLIAHRPRHTAEVVALSDARLSELFQVMAELEALCAAYAAEKMSPAEREALAQCHRDMGQLVRAGDLEGYTAANDVFHSQIYAGAKNAYLGDLTSETRLRLQPFRRAQFQSLGRLAASHEEHDRVLLAILRGDRAGAHAAMLGHIIGVRDAFSAMPRG
jgi:DNA-binding GntR family transcriptional regulator